MTTEFIEIIDLIQREIGTYYQGGAIAWIDETRDSAWSKAILRFEDALIHAGKTGNHEHARSEARIYKASCGEFLRAYKKHRTEKKVGSLFDKLEEQQLEMKGAR